MWRVIVLREKKQQLVGKKRNDFIIQTAVYKFHWATYNLGVVPRGFFCFWARSVVFLHLIYHLMLEAYSFCQLFIYSFININFSNKFTHTKPNQRHNGTKRGELSKEVPLISVTTVFFSLFSLIHSSVAVFIRICFSIYSVVAVLFFLFHFLRLCYYYGAVW